MRLIDADALTKEIEDFNCKNCNHYNHVRCRACPIDDAVTYIDEAPTVVEWISVEDKLPKNPDGYPHSEIRRSYFLVALKSGCVESLGFDFDRMQWQHTGSPVTHWMSLPEPPEVKQE